MAEMRSVEYYLVGIGSLFSAGFLTYLQNSQGTSFGSLASILEVLGVMFIGYGFVNEFVLSRLNSKVEQINKQ
ncbi:MAG: hypothetical protein ACP5U0_08070 [Caldisphaera sp.]